VRHTSRSSRKFRASEGRLEINRLNMGESRRTRSGVAKEIADLEYEKGKREIT
jgi:hypothetical protein